MAEGNVDDLMMAERSEPSNVVSNDTQTRQGNAYGVSLDAAQNFRDDAKKQGEALLREAEAVNAEYEKWDAVCKDLGEPEDAFETEDVEETPEPETEVSATPEPPAITPPVQS